MSSKFLFLLVDLSPLCASHERTPGGSAHGSDAGRGCRSGTLLVVKGRRVRGLDGIGFGDSVGSEAEDDAFSGELVDEVDALLLVVDVDEHARVIDPGNV